jgi:uncharacterized protein YqeY
VPLKQQIDADLKQAMLSGDKVLTTTLRGIKSAILYAEVAASKRDDGLTDDEIVLLLTKEAKKRQESADLYARGGNDASAQAELMEREVIARYLPAQLSDGELRELVEAAIATTGAVGQQDMGKVMSIVKQQAGASADGARVAMIVKEKLTQ